MRQQGRRRENKRASERGVCDQKAQDHRSRDEESQLADRGRRKGGGAKEAEGGDERERTDGGRASANREVFVGIPECPRNARFGKSIQLATLAEPRLRSFLQMRESEDRGNQTYSTCVDNVRREARQRATKLDSAPKLLGREGYREGARDGEGEEGRVREVARGTTAANRWLEGGI